MLNGSLEHASEPLSIQLEPVSPSQSSPHTNQPSSAARRSFHRFPLRSAVVERVQEPVAHFMSDRECLSIDMTERGRLPTPKLTALPSRNYSTLARLQFFSICTPGSKHSLLVENSFIVELLSKPALSLTSLDSP
jgi:hypothetical protein